jgi:hypothetical protein
MERSLSMNATDSTQVTMFFDDQPRSENSQRSSHAMHSGDLSARVAPRITRSRKGGATNECLSMWSLPHGSARSVGS